LPLQVRDLAIKDFSLIGDGGGEQCNNLIACE
jgi:hypothetical protein